jgi:hypothetical protein
VRQSNVAGAYSFRARLAQDEKSWTRLGKKNPAVSGGGRGGPLGENGRAIELWPVRWSSTSIMVFRSSRPKIVALRFGFVATIHLRKA